jgi:tetratricopeptide (TPR) repeat protein
MATVSEMLLRARQSHAGGASAEACRLYQQILTLEPNNREALIMLALGCQQRGELRDAADFYARALANRPADADLHLRLGLVQMVLHQRSDATGHFREAVRLRPESPEAWNNLGNMLLLDGESEEAARCYREAVRLRPDYAEACLNLGNALREHQQIPEALAWYREALRLRPTYAKALHNLAAAFLETGDLPQAEEHLRASLRINPGSASVLATLAVHGLYRETDPAAEELRARLSGPRLSLLESSHLHYTLAQILDRAGRHGEAFHHLRECNDLRGRLAARAGEVFDPAAHSRLVDGLISVFSPRFFERVRGLGLETDVPVFIVGMPRSGSSLVEQILSHHPEIGGVGELRALPLMLDSVSKGSGQPYPEGFFNVDAATLRNLAETYLARIQALAGPRRRIADKMLENFLHLGVIAALFPRARVVHCRRNALDTCLSCYFQILRGFNYTLDLGDLGTYYREYERLMEHWRAVLPVRIMEVVYEDLVKNTEKTSRELVAYCGVDWDDNCLRFHENPRAVRTMSKLQVRRPIYSSSVGKWRRYAEHLEPLRKALGHAVEATQ